MLSRGGNFGGFSFRLFPSACSLPAGSLLALPSPADPEPPSPELPVLLALPAASL